MLIDSQKLTQMIDEHLKKREGYGDIYEVYSFIDYLEAEKCKEEFEMAKKKKPEMTMICDLCKYPPKETKQGNFYVYPSTCPKCGGRVNLRFVEEE